MSSAIRLEQLVSCGTVIASLADVAVFRCADYQGTSWAFRLSETVNAPLVFLAQVSTGTVLTRRWFPTEQSLPETLCQESGLSVEILAQLAHVSRQRYYLWRRGEGISPENEERLAQLLKTLRSLKAFKPDLKTFLTTPTSLGVPMKLLARGEHDTVLGLARFDEPVRSSEGSRLLHFPEIPRRVIDGRSAAYQHYNSGAVIDQALEVDDQDEEVHVGSIVFAPQ